MSTTPTPFKARGSALVPGLKYWYVSGSSFLYTQLYISSITNTMVDCKVTVFDHEGNDVSTDCVILTGNNSGANTVVVSTGTGEFSLAAGATNQVRIRAAQAGTFIFGHAVIEWSSEDTKIRQALIATADRQKELNGRAYASMIPINGGLPF